MISTVCLQLTGLVRVSEHPPRHMPEVRTRSKSRFSDRLRMAFQMRSCVVVISKICTLLTVTATLQRSR
ncbi:hypothetical protein Y032_0177g576 [Ancylostoma ceylanicum]|uniref:Uncharacterized protein n=1 Tax=Ancylostoma ceylanicum TaxID=53326 RepID=A0A016SU89_9BILA|nr:hypothetical protein Y032_0177g576 [Ancylostoma ceylanicum]